MKKNVLVKRLSNFPEIEARMIHKLWLLVRERYKDGKWHEFKGKFRVKGKEYGFECIFRLDNQFLSFKEKSIRDPETRLILPASLS
jgi:hypothetical protein